MPSGVHGGALADGVVDLTHQVLRRLLRGKRSVGSGRICRVSCHLGGHLLGELPDEFVVDAVGDDHPLRCVAGLAGVLHPGLGGRLRHTSEIGAVEHDEGVRSTKLQHDLLEVLAGPGCHGRTGTLAAGHRHATNPGVGDHGGDLLVGGEDVDVGVGRQPGVAEDLLHRQRRLRALRRVLEDDRVSDHQVRGREPGHLVIRVVPRHDAQQRPDRGLPHPCRSRRPGGQRLILEQLRALLGVVPVDARGELQFALGLGGGLAHLAGDDRAQVTGAVAVELGDPAQHVRPLGLGRMPPRRVPPFGPGQHLADLGVRRRRELPFELARCRIHYLVLHGSASIGRIRAGGADQRPRSPGNRCPFMMSGARAAHPIRSATTRGCLGGSVT